MNPRTLLIGLNPMLEEFLQNLALPCEVIKRDSDLAALAEEILSPSPTLILCGIGTNGHPDPTFVNEAAQVLRMNHQNATIFFLSTTREGFNRSLYLKNGFNDAFLMPIEAEMVSEAIRLALANSGAEIAHFKSVNVVDITPGVVLGFDIYIHLPMNNKHIKFASADKALDEARTRRLIDQEVGSVKVPLNQMQNFYKFTAQQLQNIGRSGGSVTEARERREKAVRNLLSGLLEPVDPQNAFAKGKELLEDCREIVKSYISTGDAEAGAWYEKLMASIGAQSGSANHAANVATFCALFSLGTGIGKPEDMALAGLLHDIGLADVPAEVISTPEHKRSPAQVVAYQYHCDHSVRIIKERKMVVPDIVIKAIEQHHERFDGTGYPKRLTPEKIRSEAQLLAFADYFEEQMTPQAGRPNRAPREIVANVYNSISANAANSQFDPDLIRRILKLFPDPKTKKEVA